MALETIPSDVKIEEMLAALDRDGAVIVENLIPPDTLAAMREAILARAREIEPGDATQGLPRNEFVRDFVGASTIRFSSLGRLSPAFFDILENEVFGALSDAVLLPLCGSYWINTGQAMLIGPGETAQPLHRDCANWPQFCGALWPNCPEVTLSSIIALEDVTEELGATRVIPGSHRWESMDGVGDPGDTVPAELSAGSALIYSGKVLHGGGANRTSDAWRRAMHLSFVVGWLRPEEATALDYTAEGVRDLSPRVQRLLGHRSYDPSPTFGGGLWLKDVNRLEDLLDLGSE